MISLAGKVGVVTGGAGGIGSAIARRFGEEGMKVVVADVLPDALEVAVQKLTGDGIDATGVVTDVTDFASVQHLAEVAQQTYGRVHVVCNNAGTGGVSEGYMWEHDLADWQWGIDVNVIGVIHGIKAFVPILVAQDEGHVINTCSGNGSFAPIARGALGGPAMAVYPMTKAAVLCLTESLYTHLQLAQSKVRASALFPAGFLNTGIWESWRHRPDKYAPTQDRQTPEQTLDAVTARFASAGVTIAFTPLEQVAAQVIDGLVDGRFWMMGGPSPSDQVMVKKAESIMTRGEPDYLIDTLSQSAAKEPAQETDPDEAKGER